MMPCPSCNSLGYIEITNDILEFCVSCDGSGKVTPKQKYLIERSRSQLINDEELDSKCLELFKLSNRLGL